MSMILSVLLTAALAAPPNDTPPPPKTTAQSAPKKHGVAPKKDTTPDADLIGFLGDYEDAADGLDPIGLSEQIAEPAASTSDQKKDGHEP